MVCVPPAAPSHGDIHIGLDVDTGEKDLELPVRSEQRVVVTAYEELRDGRIRPRAVSVWGRGGFDDDGGKARLRIEGGGWLDGTPCTRFTTVCPGNVRDADGYCADTSRKPSKTVHFCGETEGGAGADFSAQVNCRSDSDLWWDNHPVLWMRVVAPVHDESACGIEVAKPEPATPVAEAEHRLPPRGERAWRRYVIEER